MDSSTTLVPLSMCSTRSREPARSIDRRGRLMLSPGASHIRAGKQPVWGVAPEARRAFTGRPDYGACGRTVKQTLIRLVSCAQNVARDHNPLGKNRRSMLSACCDLPPMLTRELEQPNRLRSRWKSVAPFIVITHLIQLAAALVPVEPPSVANLELRVDALG